MTPDDDSSENSRRDRSVFILLLALYGLVLYPILRANRYYHDDLKRALVGHTGWDSNGRPLTTLLMKLLQNYDRALVDISPLTQIGAVAILAWAGVLIARRYSIRPPWIAALITFPLGAQPFYLANLSYKFDSLSMSLAMFLALVPITAIGTSRRGWWMGVVALFASLNLYQPAFNTYLIFVLLEVVMAQVQGTLPRQLVRNILSRALQGGVAMLIYQLLVGIHIRSWVRQKSEMIDGLNELPQIGTNIADFAGFIGSSFNAQWWLCFGPMLVLLGAFPVIAGMRYATRAEVSVVGRAFFYASAIVLPCAALACILGPMLVLIQPPVEARVLLGIGALLTAALVVMWALMRQWRRSDNWTISLAGILAIGMCALASAYGNASGQQQRYEERIAANLADDLAEAKANRAVNSILLYGTAGYSPLTAHVVSQIPLLGSLMPPYLDAQDTFDAHLFLDYYVADFAQMRLGTDAEATKAGLSVLARSCNTPAFRNTSAYRLYLIDDVAVVKFGDPKDCTYAAIDAAPKPPIQLWRRSSSLPPPAPPPNQLAHAKENPA